MDMVRERELNVPIFQKQNLTIEEAAVYSNIGQHKLRELTADERCPFVLWVGNKRLIKRRQFDVYMSSLFYLNCEKCEKCRPSGKPMVGRILKGEFYYGKKAQRQQRHYAEI